MNFIKKLLAKIISKNVKMLAHFDYFIKGFPLKIPIKNNRPNATALPSPNCLIIQH